MDILYLVATTQPSTGSMMRPPATYLQPRLKSKLNKPS